MDDETAADTEVLIAGAGPVGLALALELQRFGIRLRIVEKKAERSTTSKALGLQPRLSEVFAILGIAGKFSSAGSTEFERLISARARRNCSRLRCNFHRTWPGAGPASRG